MLILEHFFASKQFAALHDAFSNGSPDKEAPDKTVGNKILGHGVFVACAHREEPK